MENISSPKLKFLQKMISKNQEQEEKDFLTPEKVKWTNKMNTLSSSKLKASTSSPTVPALERKTLLKDEYYLTGVKKNFSIHENLQSSRIEDSLEVTDIEKLVNEFEMGYSSPRHNKSQISNNKFVKKMVAIFEKKTSTKKKPSEFYNDCLIRGQSDSPIICENSKKEITPEKKTPQVEKQTTNFVSSTNISLRSFKIHDYYGDPSADTEELDEVRHASTTSDDDTVIVSNGTASFDDSQSISDETHLTSDDEKQSTSNRFSQEDRAPKIIGAFLKKPIKVDDTIIDWLPTPYLKLQRKGSFSKFFSLLKGKGKCDDSSSSSSSQNSLRKKSNKTRKNSHDSGYYDEREKSQPSSWTPMQLIEEIVENEKERHNDDPWDKRVLTFQTFKPSKNEIEKKEESCVANKKIDIKPKIILEEVPRSEIRLSLGPTDKHVATFGNVKFPDVGQINNQPKHYSESDPGPCISNGDELCSNFDTHENWMKYINEQRISNTFPRSRSNIYEEAQALKRKNDCISATFNIQSNLYAPFCTIKPEFATIKPRNFRKYQNRNIMAIENFKMMRALTIPSIIADD